MRLSYRLRIGMFAVLIALALFLGTTHAVTNTVSPPTFTPPNITNVAPLALIVILILAAAGLTRGADIFQMFGVGSLLGIGGGAGKAGAGKGFATAKVKTRFKSMIKGYKPQGLLAPAAGLAAAGAMKGASAVRNKVLPKKDAAKMTTRQLQTRLPFARLAARLGINTAVGAEYVRRLGNQAMRTELSTADKKELGRQIVAATRGVTDSKKRSAIAAEITKKFREQALVTKYGASAVGTIAGTGGGTRGAYMRLATRYRLGRLEGTRTRAERRELEHTAQHGRTVAAEGALAAAQAGKSRRAGVPELSGAIGRAGAEIRYKWQALREGGTQSRTSMIPFIRAPFSVMWIPGIGVPVMGHALLAGTQQKATSTQNAYQRNLFLATSRTFALPASRGGPPPIPTRGGSAPGGGTPGRGGPPPIPTRGGAPSPAPSGIRHNIRGVGANIGASIVGWGQTQSQRLSDWNRQSLGEKAAWFGGPIDFGKREADLKRELQSKDLTDKERKRLNAQLDAVQLKIKNNATEYRFGSAGAGLGGMYFVGALVVGAAMKGGYEPIQSKMKERDMRSQIAELDKGIAIAKKTLDAAKSSGDAQKIKFAEDNLAKYKSESDKLRSNLSERAMRKDLNGVDAQLKEAQSKIDKIEGPGGERYAALLKNASSDELGKLDRRVEEQRRQINDLNDTKKALEESLKHVAPPVGQRMDEASTKREITRLGKRIDEAEASREAAPADAEVRKQVGDLEKRRTELQSDLTRFQAWAGTDDRQVSVQVKELKGRMQDLQAQIETEQGRKTMLGPKEQKEVDSKIDGLRKAQADMQERIDSSRGLEGLSGRDIKSGLKGVQRDVDDANETLRTGTKEEIGKKVSDLQSQRDSLNEGLSNIDLKKTSREIKDRLKEIDGEREKYEADRKYAEQQLGAIDRANTDLERQRDEWQARKQEKLDSGILDTRQEDGELGKINRKQQTYEKRADELRDMSSKAKEGLDDRDSEASDLKNMVPRRESIFKGDVPKFVKEMGESMKTSEERTREGYRESIDKAKEQKEGGSLEDRIMAYWHDEDKKRREKEEEEEHEKRLEEARKAHERRSSPGVAAASPH